MTDRSQISLSLHIHKLFMQMKIKKQTRSNQELITYICTPTLP
uniref:Uncharacterized protein n=1 Tax=Anguilla anguilla TaxID=7936 RepID=A0A0E9U281_ANGAN